MFVKLRFVYTIVKETIEISNKLLHIPEFLFSKHFTLWKFHVYKTYLLCKFYNFMKFEEISKVSS